MSALELLATSPAVLIGASVVLGLMVGSFLNVVIYRLPIMLEREWRSQAADVLAGAALGCRPTLDISPEEVRRDAIRMGALTPVLLMHMHRRHLGLS